MSAIAFAEVHVIFTRLCSLTVGDIPLINHITPTDAVRFVRAVNGSQLLWHRYGWLSARLVVRTIHEYSNEKQWFRLFFQSKFSLGRILHRRRHARRDCPVEQSRQTPADGAALLFRILLARVCTQCVAKLFRRHARRRRSRWRCSRARRPRRRHVCRLDRDQTDRPTGTRATERSHSQSFGSNADRYVSPKLAMIRFDSFCVQAYCSLSQASCCPKFARLELV